MNYQFSFLEGTVDQCLCRRYLKLPMRLVANGAASPGSQASGWVIKVVSLSSFAWEVWKIPPPR